MITDRYYYSRLSEYEKKVYSRLYKGITALETEIPVSGNVEKDSIARIYHALSDDNPYFYYFNQSTLDIRRTAQETIFLPQFFCSGEQIDTYNGRINEIVNRLMIELDLANADETRKERRIHDWFCQNVVYDEEAVNTDARIGRLIAAHSIIGVFARKRAVCEGIAKATKILFNTANMGCIVVSGESNRAAHKKHTWNIIKVNGNAYHLDMTWDIALSKEGHIGYDYYNLPEAAICLDHGSYDAVPECETWKENYFVQEGLLFPSQRKLEQYLDRAIEAGQRDLYFRMNDNGRRTTKEIILCAQRYVLDKLARDDAVQWKVRSSLNAAQRIGRIQLEPVM